MPLLFFSLSLLSTVEYSLLADVECTCVLIKDLDIGYQYRNGGGFSISDIDISEDISKDISNIYQINYKLGLGFGLGLKFGLGLGYKLGLGLGFK